MLWKKLCTALVVHLPPGTQPPDLLTVGTVLAFTSKKSLLFQCLLSPSPACTDSIQSLCSLHLSTVPVATGHFLLLTISSIIKSNTFSFSFDFFPTSFAILHSDSLLSRPIFSYFKRWIVPVTTSKSFYLYTLTHYLAITKHLWLQMFLMS